MAKKPTALIILDGFANRESEHGNAVKLANKPNFRSLLQQISNDSNRSEWLRCWTT